MHPGGWPRGPIHIHDASRSTPVAPGDSTTWHRQSSAHSRHIHTHGRNQTRRSESISSVNKARSVVAIPGAATVTLRPTARAQIVIEIEIEIVIEIEIEIELETQSQILPSHIGHSAMRARNQPHCWHALLIRPRPVCCPWWACRSVHA